jgi:ribonuclease E
MGKISRFGLMELSRQRLRPSLSEGARDLPALLGHRPHPRYRIVRLQVLRIIQEEAMKENSATIHVQVPVDVAAFLLNEKRGEVLKIETRHRITVILVPNKHLETPHYKLERIKHDDPRLEDSKPATPWPSKPKPTWPTASARRKKPSRARKPWSRPSPLSSRRRWSTASRPKPSSSRPRPQRLRQPSKVSSPS